MDHKLTDTTLRLLEYCRQNEWAGYEPYDALNSRLFDTIPVLNNWLPRLVMTQFLKRSPVNIRPFLRIPPTQNPKGLGLFLSSLVLLRRAGISADQSDIDSIVRRLVTLRSPGVSNWCWGYNFPWQTRTVLVPRWSPNLVCTTFAAAGLLDLYAHQPKDEYLVMAVSSAEYLLDNLYWSSGNCICGFGYPMPEVHNQVHNANLLAAGLFCRVYGLTGQERFLTPALAVTRYTVSQQHADGGWDYGEASTQKWIDNFHTGFNLSALRTISVALGTSEFDDSIAKGLNFYREHFFREDGAVGYFHKKFYPIDTHCFAQSIITLLDFAYLDSRNAELAYRVYNWARERMWDEKRGYFYYRILPWCTIRTSYMRWTQAWMLLALAMLVANSGHEIQGDPASRNTAELQAC
jgi:hypothetical protein